MSENACLPRGPYHAFGNRPIGNRYEKKSQGDTAKSRDAESDSATALARKHGAFEQEPESLRERDSKHHNGRPDCEHHANNEVFCRDDKDDQRENEDAI